ncbi:MAG: hypothetical protein JNM78_03410 [Cyclobacteriaceae bacterium]|nr:hypothetical protein [Cyclobacteriaceae bacterium]
MKRQFLIAFVCLPLSFFVYPVLGQEGQPENLAVIYDPLFWKEELKLKDSQCQSIQKINSEYYQLIESSVKDSSASIPEIQEIAKEGLVERSQKIWDTLHTNQKRKWMKMWQHQYGP